MELIKDLFYFFVNIFVYYADFIKFIVSLFINKIGYVDFFTIYISFFIPTALLYKRIVRQSFLDVSLNITLHIYLFIMVGFAVMGSNGIVFKNVNGELQDIARGTFFWFLLTMYGIQTIAHKVSVIETAGKRVVDYRESINTNKRKNNRFYKVKKIRD